MKTFIKLTIQITLNYPHTVWIDKNWISDANQRRDYCKDICDLLLVFRETLVNDLADAGIEALELFILGGDIGGGGLRGEDTHESGQEAVDGADHLRVGTRHACGDPALEGLEARQDHLLPL